MTTSEDTFSVPSFDNKTWIRMTCASKCIAIAYSVVKVVFAKNVTDTMPIDLSK